MIAHWLQKALQLHGQGKLAEAEPLYIAILKMQPDNFDAMQLLGTLRHRQGRYDEAETLLKQALAVNWRVAAVQFNLGNVLLDLGRPSEALESFDKALKLKSDHIEARYSRGLALAGLMRYEDAVKSYDRALALKPDHAGALNNRGNALSALKRYGDALASYEQAIAVQIGLAEAHNNRGVMLEHLLRPEEALESYRRAIAVKSDFAKAFTNAGTVLSQLGEHQQALEMFDRGLALNPHDSDALLGRGIVHLLTGRLATGWPDFEHRFGKTISPPERLITPYPDWSGEALEGNHILVYEEQGLGDVIQFARYLPLLAAAGAKVTLLVRPDLHRLLQPLSHAVRLVDDIPLEPFDFQCALMSLPGLLKTTLSTIPAEIPYLAAEPDRVANWRRRISGGGIRIGIAWQGNPDGMIDIGRSIPLSAFAALAKVPGVRLISLQKLHGLDQLEDLPATMQVEIPAGDVDEGPDAFVDTAAIMANLDLIITSDTAVAHLAGSLGRPTWLALKTVPDWRWLLDRSDSPWYPTMRLYRQAKRGDWSGVFDQMAIDLTKLTVSAR